MTPEQQSLVDRKLYSRTERREASFAEPAGSAAVIVAKGYYRLKEENERLKEWIRQEGMRNDTCTYDVLHEICDGCRCKRQPQQNDQAHA